MATAVFSLSSVRARDSWLTVANVTPWPAAARMNPLLAVTCWSEYIFRHVEIKIVLDVYRDHAEGVARGEDGEGPALDLARGGEAGRLVRALVRHHLTHTDRVNIMKLLLTQRSKYGLFSTVHNPQDGW